MNTIFETMKLRDHFEESARLAQDILQDASFFEAMSRGADLLIGMLEGRSQNHVLWQRRFHVRCHALR